MKKERVRQKEKSRSFLYHGESDAEVIREDN
jgi:hypothetical protein